jgi:two-component system OmpR family response regulator
MKLLVLEDDAELSSYLEHGLRELGHNVAVTGDGFDALYRILDETFDVAILDRMVSGLDGLSVLRRARRDGCQTPALMLTALAGIEDRVEALEAGADDYLVKPFDFSELAARLNALARRAAPVASQQVLTAGDIEMSLLRRTVKRGGRAVELQPREFSILEHLMRNADRIVTRTLLLEKVWDFGFDPQTNIVETHMSRLRSKLNEGFSVNAIRTIRGSGYILNCDAD